MDAPGFNTLGDEQLPTRNNQTAPLNIAALDALASAAPNWIPGDRLAEILGIAPKQLRSDLDRLEAFGFSLEHHPHYGLRYVGPAVQLCPDQIEWQLGTRLIGRRVAVWNRVVSTNDLAMRAALSTANEGLAVLAEEQTHGRGRRGRHWHAPPRTGLLLSVLLFPPRRLQDPALLTCLAATAVCETLEQSFDLKPQIKWPNDVQVNRRKVCGILVELAVGAVVGIGLNCNLRLEDFPPELRETSISVADVVGQTIDRSQLARRLLQKLDARYHELCIHGPESLWSNWRNRAGLVGATVEIELARECVGGVVASIDAHGTLHLERRGGPSRAVRLQHVRKLTVQRGQAHR